MKTQPGISQILEVGEIQNELDFERALIADRKLRVLAKEDPKYKIVRKKLRNLIEDYEKQNWSSDSKISDSKIRESYLAETIAERERQFIQKRKELIKKKLKTLNLTQENFGTLLGHSSKSYMSELINGVSPFSLKDLIVINRLLKINLTELIPPFLSPSDLKRIRTSVQKLDNPKLNFSSEDLVPG